MVQPATQDRVLFAPWLQGLALSAFINAFLHIKFRGQVVKWVLYPLQRKMCEALDAAATVREAVFWLLKARQVGGTEIIAAWCILKCMAFPGYTILVLSKNGGAAQKFITRKIIPLLDRLYKYAPHLPWPSYTRTKNLIQFGNGSWLEAINSADHAGRGETVDAVIMDEAGAGEFKHHAEEIYQSVQGATEHGSSAFMVVMGTSAPGTWFNIKSEEYNRDPGPGVYFWFLAMSVFPWRDRSTPEGAAWWAAKVRRLGEVGAKQEYPSTPEDAFLSKSGFVFATFETPKGRHVRRIDLDWTWLYLLVYDHGRTKEHPAILWHTLYGRHINHWHVFAEQAWDKGQGLLEICRDMVDFRNKLKAELAAQQKVLPKPARLIADTAITNDDGRQTIRDIIHRKAGYYFQPAMKHDKKVSLDFFIARIDEDKFSIDPDCTLSIYQISHLLWSDKKSQYGKPDEVQDDAPDLGRYGCAEINAKLLAKIEEEKPLKPYDPKARQYRQEHSIHAPQKPVAPDWRSW